MSFPRDSPIATSSSRSPADALRGKPLVFVVEDDADIARLIEPDPDNPTYLKTVRGIGYRFDVPKESGKVR